MSQPAARLGDMHVCPLSDGPKPHVGGPIMPPCQPTVLIGGMPAARVGDQAFCASMPDVIAQGSTTVLIGGKMAARLGDMTMHGGTITVGCPTVLIGGPTGGTGGMGAGRGAGRGIGRGSSAGRGIIGAAKRKASELASKKPASKWKALLNLLRRDKGPSMRSAMLGLKAEGKTPWYKSTWGKFTQWLGNVFGKKPAPSPPKTASTMEEALNASAKGRNAVSSLKDRNVPYSMMPASEVDAYEKDHPGYTINGYHNPATNSISLNPRLAPEQQAGTLIHEAKHSAQAPVDPRAYPNDKQAYLDKKYANEFESETERISFNRELRSSGYTVPEDDNERMYSQAYSKSGEAAGNDALKANIKKTYDGNGDYGKDWEKANADQR